ncbi:hypothetical protein [Rubritalea tangerina]|uniref:hypothetical protein n=1 Tax=Rubritalea tangerina TaxID=430798 RepID=UPI003608192F
MFVHTSAHSISGFPSTTKKLVIDLNYVPFMTDIELPTQQSIPQQKKICTISPFCSLHLTDNSSLHTYHNERPSRRPSRFPQTLRLQRTSQTPNSSR